MIEAIDFLMTTARLLGWVLINLLACTLIFGLGCALTQGIKDIRRD